MVNSKNSGYIRQWLDRGSCMTMRRGRWQKQWKYLKCFEGKILRKIFGPYYGPNTNQYRMWTNVEVKSIYNDSDVKLYSQTRLTMSYSDTRRKRNSRNLHYDTFYQVFEIRYKQTKKFDQMKLCNLNICFISTFCNHQIPQHIWNFRQLYFL